MQIVIDILEETYKNTCDEKMLPPDVKNVVEAIKNGTPLRKGHVIEADEKGVLEQIAEEQNTLSASVAEWNKAIDKRGYIN